MQHMITDEEVKRFDDIYVKYDGGSDDECVKAALLDFLNNRPESTLGKLRPIAEMPETVPEGCVRQHYRLDEFKGIRAGVPGNTVDHWAIDILTPTPDPEAEERQRFEEAMKGRMWMPADFEFKNGEYATPSLAAHYDTWKLAKA